MFTRCFVFCLFSLVFIRIRGLRDSLTEDEEMFLAGILPSGEVDFFIQTTPRVAPGHIPPGVAFMAYAHKEQKALVKWYQSTKVENTKRLLKKIATNVNIHPFYRGFVGIWNRLQSFVTNVDPVSFRDSVSSSNAVDLILQDLYNNAVDSFSIVHYYTDDAKEKSRWVSNAQKRETLPWKNGKALSSVIRRNAQSNSRYLMVSEKKSSWFAKTSYHAFNMIVDEKHRIWVIDGQKRRLYDFADPKDVKAFNRAFGMEEGHYHSDFMGHAFRIYSGMFKPPAELQEWQERDQNPTNYFHSKRILPKLDKEIDESLLNEALSE